jgi:hypothetical protein
MHYIDLNGTPDPPPFLCSRSISAKRNRYCALRGYDAQMKSPGSSRHPGLSSWSLGTSVRSGYLASDQ